MGVRSLSLPFILVHTTLFNVGLHSYPVGGQEAPSCGLLLYEVGTDSALSPSGWGHSTTWTLWCPPLTVMGHGVVTMVESQSQGLSFCCLAGIEAASWKNVVKDFDVAQQEEKVLSGSDVECFLGTRPLLTCGWGLWTRPLWVGACGHAPSCLVGWGLLTQPQFSFSSSAPCSWHHLPPDMSGQNQLTHGGVSAEPHPTGAQHRGYSLHPSLHSASQVACLADWCLYRL